jgi:hypothetical protein
MNKKETEETRKQYERSTNPTLVFVEDNCHQDQEKHMEKDHFYRCLKKYCEQLKLPTPNASTFGQKLKEMTDWVITGESIYDPERKTKFAYWRGIAFNDDSPFSPNACTRSPNSIPLTNEEKNILKNNSENPRTQGLDKNVSAYTENAGSKTETNSEAQSAYTDQYAGRIVKQAEEFDVYPLYVWEEGQRVSYGLA